MALPSVFDSATVQSITNRLKQLQADSRPAWGTMNAGQMLAHCNVTYEYVFEPEKHPPMGAVMRWLMKTFVKQAVVSEKPYKPSSPTGKDFKVSPDQDFALERQRLIHFIEQVQQMGSSAFEGRMTHGFGSLSANEWNNMFYKHLDHHLRQFGV